MLRRTAIRSALTVAPAVLCASLLCAPRLYAQDAPTAPPAAKVETEAKQEKARGDALVRVRGLADRIERMREPDIKIRALAQLAGITCKYDKTAAELIFHRAHRAFEAAQRDAQGTRQSEVPIDYESIGHEVFQEMLRCQPALAIRLMRPRDDDKADESQAIAAANDLNEANSLLEQDAAKAAELALRALNAPLDRMRATVLLDFLLNLRSRNAALADQLFVQAIATLRLAPRPNIECLQILGNYLFKSTMVLVTDSSAGGFVIGLASANGATSNHTWVTPELARTYLEAALDLLSRPVTDWRLQKIDAGALANLLAKSQEFAPDLTPSFQLVLNRIRESMGGDNATVAEYLVGIKFDDEEEPDSVSAQLKNVEDPDQRDTLLLRRATGQLRRGRSQQARNYILQIKNAGLRERLERLADFVEAAGGLAGQDMDLAFAALNRLPPGAHRAMMNMGYAVMFFEGKHSDRGSAGSARASLNLGERDLERLPARVRARLLAAATAISGLHDNDPVLGPQNTLALLRRTVSACNEARREEERRREEPLTAQPTTTKEAPKNVDQSAHQPELEADEGGITELITFGDHQDSFHLHVEGVEIFHLRELQVYQRLGQSARAAENILSQLEDESILAPALAALAVAYLEEGFRKPAAPAPSHTTRLQ